MTSRSIATGDIYGCAAALVTLVQTMMQEDGW
jgi:hypothetical protein